MKLVIFLLITISCLVLTFQDTILNTDYIQRFNGTKIESGTDSDLSSLLGKEVIISGNCLLNPTTTNRKNFHNFDNTKMIVQKYSRDKDNKINKLSGMIMDFDKRGEHIVCNNNSKFRVEHALKEKFRSAGVHRNFIEECQGSGFTYIGYIDKNNSHHYEKNTDEILEEYNVCHGEETALNNGGGYKIKDNKRKGS